MFLLNLELSTRNNGKTWQPVYSVSVRIRYTKRIPLKETLPPLIAFGWNRCLRLESLSLVGIAVTPFPFPKVRIILLNLHVMLKSYA